MNVSIQMSTNSSVPQAVCLDEVETKKLFEGKENVIFERLQNYQKSFQRCRERTKKKLNSGSSPAPMKD